MHPGSQVPSQTCDSDEYAAVDSSIRPNPVTVSPSEHDATLPAAKSASTAFALLNTIAGVPLFVATLTGPAFPARHVVCAPESGAKAKMPPSPLVKTLVPRESDDTAPAGVARQSLRVTPRFKGIGVLFPA